MSSHRPPRRASPLTWTTHDHVVPTAGAGAVAAVGRILLPAHAVAGDRTCRVKRVLIEIREPTLPTQSTGASFEATVERLADVGVRIDRSFRPIELPQPIPRGRRRSLSPRQQPNLVTRGVVEDAEVATALVDAANQSGVVGVYADARLSPARPGTDRSGTRGRKRRARPHPR